MRAITARAISAARWGTVYTAAVVKKSAKEGVTLHAACVMATTCSGDLATAAWMSLTASAGLYTVDATSSDLEPPAAATSEGEIILPAIAFPINRQNNITFNTPISFKTYIFRFSLYSITIVNVQMNLSVKKC
jgi:hypothetical protein